MDQASSRFTLHHLILYPQTVLCSGSMGWNFMAIRRLDFSSLSIRWMWVWTIRSLLITYGRLQPYPGWTWWCFCLGSSSAPTCKNWSTPCLPYATLSVRPTNLNQRLFSDWQAFTYATHARPNALNVWDCQRIAPLAMQLNSEFWPQTLAFLKQGITIQEQTLRFLAIQIV